MAAAAADDGLLGEEFVTSAMEGVPLTCTEHRRALAHVAQVPADRTGERSTCRDHDAVGGGIILVHELVDHDLDGVDVLHHGLGLQALEGGVARGVDGVLLDLLHDHLLVGGLLVALLGLLVPLR